MNRSHIFKKALVSAVLVFLFAALFPAWGKISERVSLSCNHPDGRYLSGEEIVFDADAGSGIDIIAEVYVNGVRSAALSPGKVHLPQGKTTLLRITPEEPSSIILRVFESSDKNDFSDVGAVSDPDSFAPRIPFPKDMHRFWNKRIRAMRRVPMTPVLTPVPVPEKDRDKFEAYALEINCPAGENPVRGIMVLPRNASSKSLPVVVFLHGAGVSKPGNRSSVAVALRGAKLGGGAISLDINAHGYRDDMPQAYYDSLEQTVLKDYIIQSATSHESFYYYGMFMRAQRALDYLCTLKEWDRKRVLVYGSSQGGLQSAALAGMDRRVKAAVLTVPGFIDVTVSKREPPERGCIPTFYERYGPDDQVIPLLPYYDAANFLKLTKAKLLVEAGLVDFTCPAKCVIGGFNTAVSKDKVLLTAPFRPHSNIAVMNTEQLREWQLSVDRVRIRFMEDYLAPAKAN